MTDDEIRERLLAACEAAWPGAVSNRNTADALLPTVLAITADELRAMADDLTISRPYFVDCSKGEVLAGAATLVRARARAVEAS